MSGRNLRSACWKLWHVAALPHVVAIPVSVTARAVQSGEFYILPIVLICTVLLLLLVILVVKRIYTKHRRIKTIHASSLAYRPSGMFQSSGSLSSLHSASTRGVKGSNALAWKGLVVGCLADPGWESHIKSGVDEQIRMQQRSSFIYSMRREPTDRGRPVNSNPLQTDDLCSQVTDTLLKFGLIDTIGNPQAVSSMRGPSEPRMVAYPDECPREPDRTLPRRRSFSVGDSINAPGIHRITGDVESVSADHPSIRLVNTPRRSESYRFLSDRPPGTTASFPLMAARDSLLLSKPYVDHDRKPLPPLPSLPEDPSFIFAGLGLEYYADLAATFAEGKLSPHQLSPSMVINDVSQSVKDKPKEKQISPDCVTVSRSLPKLNDLITSRPSTSREVLVYATEQMNRRYQHKKLQFRDGRADASPLWSPLIPETCMEFIPPLSIITVEDKENDRSSSVSGVTGGVTTLRRSFRFSGTPSLWLSF